jgi:hypothetical protein
VPVAPPRLSERRLVGDNAVFGGDGMAPVKVRPAGHDRAGRPGAPLPRSLLSPARSLFIMSHSCMSTQARILHDGM